MAGSLKLQDVLMPPRVAGLNLSVGSFLPRVPLPSLAGVELTPADLVDEGELAVCVYNPAAVNPFPIPPRGIDLPRRLAMLRERGVKLYVISGLSLPRLANWLEYIGADFYVLSDQQRVFSALVGVPIKRVGGRNFRTHVSFVLQEDRVLAILLEVDPIHQFERLLMALDVAAGREPGTYVLPDRPWYEQVKPEEPQPEEPLPENLEERVEFTEEVTEADAFIPESELGPFTAEDA
ncbi:MAG: peroxiredoxin family protein [Caldilineales bacterium]|nr:peroxiredoxin family protein [Caldilineales bacterium]